MAWAAGRSPASRRHELLRVALDLSWRRLLLLGYPLEKVDHRLVRLRRLRREARQHRAEIALLDLSVLVHRAGQEAPAERAVRDQPDAEFLADLKNPVRLRPTCPQRIFVLKGRDRLHCMGASDRLHARLR